MLWKLLLYTRIQIFLKRHIFFHEWAADIERIHMQISYGREADSRMKNIR